MKLEIKTEKLKQALSKAIKGAGRNVAFPKTTIVGIECNNNLISFTTTDRTNILNVVEDVINQTPEQLNEYWAVNCELLGKLVSKITTENIIIESTAEELILKGNGTYSIPLILDSNAQPLRIDTSVFSSINFETGTCVNTTSKQLQNIALYNKPSVLKTNELPHLTGYYIDEDGVITFNGVTACINKQSTLNTKVLLPSTLVELFSTLSSEAVTIYIVGNTIKIKTDNITIYSSTMEGIEKFPGGALKNIVSETFPAECTIDKDVLSKALDRISLFIGPMDDNAIQVEFTDKLIISSKNKKNSELIEFNSHKNSMDFVKCVDIQDLKNQLQTRTSTEITIAYGSEKSLMIKDDGIYQLIPFTIDD